MTHLSLGKRLLLDEAGQDFLVVVHEITPTGSRPAVRTYVHKCVLTASSPDMAQRITGRFVNIYKWVVQPQEVALVIRLLRFFYTEDTEELVHGLSESEAANMSMIAVGIGNDRARDAAMQKADALAADALAADALAADALETAVEAHAAQIATVARQQKTRKRRRETSVEPRRGRSKSRPRRSQRIRAM